MTSFSGESFSPNSIQPLSTSLQLFLPVNFTIHVFFVDSESDPKSVWGFGFKTSVPTCSAWSVCEQNWGRSDHIAGISGSTETSPTIEVDDDVVDITPNDNLQSVLQRLDLSDYLSNFQVSMVYE